MKKIVFFTIVLVLTLTALSTASSSDKQAILDFLILNEAVGSQNDQEFTIYGWPVISWHTPSELPIAAIRHGFVDWRESWRSNCLFINIGPSSVTYAGRTASVNEISIWRIKNGWDYFATFTYEDDEKPSVAEIMDVLLHPPATAFARLDGNKDRKINFLDLEEAVAKLLPPEQHRDDWDWLKEPPPADLAPSPNLRQFLKLPQRPERPSIPPEKLATTWGNVKNKK